MKDAKAYNEGTKAYNAVEKPSLIVEDQA